MKVQVSFLVLLGLLLVCLLLVSSVTAFSQIIPPRNPVACRPQLPMRVEINTSVFVATQGLNGFFESAISPASTAYIYFKQDPAFPLTPKVILPPEQVVEGYSITVGGYPAMIEFTSENSIGFITPEQVGDGQQEVVVTNPAGIQVRTKANVKRLVPVLFVRPDIPGFIPNAVAFAVSTAGVRFLGVSFENDLVLFDGERLVLQIAISGVHNFISEDGAYNGFGIITYPGGAFTRINARTRNRGNPVPGTQDVFMEFPEQFKYGTVDTRLKIEIEIEGVKSLNYAVIRAKKFQS